MKREPVVAHSIGVIPGNEVGGRVATEALQVVRELGIELDVYEYELGPGRYRRTGEVLPEEVLEALRGMDAIFVGTPPVSGSSDIPPGLLERGIIFGLRRGLDLSVNLRVFRGIGTLEHVDVAIVRENSEGAYTGEGGVLREGSIFEVATQGSVNTYVGVERCVRFSFELARSRKKRLTLAHKSRVLVYSGSLWQRVLAALAQEFPDVETSYENIDICCARLIEDPRRYDVIVTDNMFGDILSDVACAVAGAGGHSGSAELNIAGNGPSLFEPMHSPTVYDLGERRTNLYPGISAAAMMLEHLGRSDVGAAVANAVLECATQVVDIESNHDVGSHVVSIAAKSLTGLQGQ